MASRGLAVLLEYALGGDSLSQSVVHSRLLVSASDLNYRFFAKGRQGAFVSQDS